MMSPVQVAEKTIDRVRSVSDSAVVFLSLGKDSLVLLDLVYPRFDRVVCVFMYFVKGLEHIERWIAWVKRKYPKVEIIQVPHWNLTYLLRGGVYCTPNPKVKLLKLSDVIQSVRLKTGIHHVFLGMKKADGMNRNLMLKGYESEGYIHDGQVYPLAEMNQRHVLAYMKQHGLPEPVRYGLTASNGVGFNEACFVWLERNCPQDLDKIYEVFPMSRRILFEYHYRNEVSL